MLAHDWIVLLEFETLARVDLVFASHVSEASVGCAAQLDDRTLIFALCCHDEISDFLSSAAHFGDD